LAGEDGAPLAAATTTTITAVLVIVVLVVLGVVALLAMDRGRQGRIFGTSYFALGAPNTRLCRKS
jgi:hypothetical protein